MENIRRAAQAAVAACAFGALAACGGGGDGGSSSGNPGGPSGNASPYVLFASTYGSGAIAAFTTLSPAAGSALSANVVETVPFSGYSISYDTTHDDLYSLYSDISKSKVMVFAHAATLKAGAAPARTLMLADFQFASMLVLDTANDRLWVTGSDMNSRGLIEEFEHASTLNGTPTASHSMRITSLTFAVDSGRDILYTNSYANEVEVYLHASTLSGDVSPDRKIINVDTGNELSLDASRDILYSAGGGHEVVALHGASTATTGPGTTITLPAGSSLTSNAVIDPGHDRLYVGAQDGAYVIDNASTLVTGSTLATLVQAPNTVVQSFAFAGQ